MQEEDVCHPEGDFFNRGTREKSRTSKTGAFKFEQSD